MAQGYTAFLRHGAYHQRADVPSARQPFALTDEGLAQASAGGKALAQMLSNRGLRPAPVVWCSRQLRAWQTAEAVVAQLRAHGFAIETLTETSALAERGLGAAANLRIAEIEAVLQGDPRYAPPPPGWKSDSDYCLPLEGAESLMQAGRRVADHLQAKATPGLVTVHIGHGASFRHGCHLLGLLSRDQIARLSMYHARPLLFCHEENANWSHLAGDWKVRGSKDIPAD